MDVVKQTIGYDPIIFVKQSSEFGVTWMTLNDIWSHADYITLHVPLIPATRRKLLLHIQI